MHIIQQESVYSLQQMVQETGQTINYSQDLRAHAVLLADFFGTIFDRRDQILIVPGLDDARFNSFCDDINSLPSEIGGRETTYYNKKKGRVMPRRFLDPFSRTPGSTSIKNLAGLHELNRFGYGIFYTINPVLGRKRCQKAVMMAKHILVESDVSGIDAQLRFLNEFEANIVASIHTGGKSIHSLVRITPSRWNPNRVKGWRAISNLGHGETSAPWPEYREMANFWITVAGMHSVKADESVARDHARVSRVPGFLHPVSGRTSTIIQLNPDASWDWRTAMAGWSDGEEDSPEDNELESYRATRESNLGREVNDLLAGDDVLFREFSPFGQDRRPFWEEDGRRVNMVEEINPQFHVTPTVLVEDLEERDTATSNLVRSTNQVTETSIPKTSFIDAVDEFNRLRLLGLPGRHTRRKLHRVLFETARVFGWNEMRMSAEWDTVIRMNPTATTETIEGAVVDMLAAWHSSANIGIYLPDLCKLPELDSHHMLKQEKRLIALGCCEPTKVSRIIAKVLLPLIRKLSVQCMMGTVCVQSTELRNATNVRGCSRGYSSIWRWMQEVSIVTCTKQGYFPGIHTRKYRINIPLALWLAGYTTDELDWAVAKG